VAKIPFLDDYLVRALQGQKPEYGYFVMRIYLRVVILIFGKASPLLIKGLYHSVRRNKPARIEAFLQGSRLWGEDVSKYTNSTLKNYGEINPPEKGHFIFLNHVNELDFPYDCMMIGRPYLANQVIKKTLFAYWWMLAMGSQVFDNSKARSVVKSIKRLLNGLETTSYIVYPEGHNSYSEEIRPLKKGMVKIAFDQKIPIYVAVKSGVSSYQHQRKNNFVGYMEVGLYNPTDFTKYEDLQNHLFEAMRAKKKELDQLIEGEKAKK
jgi:1-acyl-sn-glycerol-3-phosphate acyltransferase